MSLPFEPAGLPLLLGGLPHQSVLQALEVSRRYARALVTWPQLPQRSFREHSLVHSAIGFPGLVVDDDRSVIYVNRANATRELDRLGLAYLEDDVAYAVLTAGDAASLDELFRQRDSLKGSLALKGQLLGPISLAAQLTDERQRPLIYDAVFFDALVQYLCLRARLLEKHLSELSEVTIICLEEPFLDVVGLPFVPLDWEQACIRLDMVLAGISGCKALYASGAVDWSQVLQTSVELIVADVFAYSHTLLAAADALSEFLQRDGVVGLGVVPFDKDVLCQVTPEGLVSRIAGIVDTLQESGVSRDRLLRQSVVSTVGPLDQLDIATAEYALQVVADVSALLRSTYGLET